MVATLLAGYPAPALVGLAGAFVLGAGYVTALLWGLVLMCAVVLLLVRNLYGLWVVLVLGVGVGWLSWAASAPVVSGTAYLLVWVLLLVAPRAVVDLHRGRRRQGGSDADQLRGLTRVPAGAWTGFFWLVTVAALALGAWELVRFG